MIADKYGNPIKLAGWIFLPSLAFMLASCGDKDPKNTEDISNSTHLAARYYEGPRPEGVSSQNDAITTTFYIPAAAIGDMYEIEASQIAVDRAKSAEVKAFARQMIMDHSKTSQKLEEFVTNNPVNIAIPKNMDGRHSAMIENLRKASDDEFDSVYMGQQAAAHEEALNLHKSYASRGDYPKLTSLAAETAKIIEHHRDMIAKVQAAKPSPQ